MERYKRGFFYSHEFVGDNSWNGFERNCLFANLGGSDFVDVSRALAVDEVLDCRGVAVADLDGDGRLDLVIANNDAAPTLALNRVGNAGARLAIELEATRGNRDAIGSRVRLTAGGRTQLRLVEAGSGYASQSPRTLHFGLGAADEVDLLEIEWTRGAVDRIEGRDLAMAGGGAATGSVLQIREGGSIVVVERELSGNGSAD